MRAMRASGNGNKRGKWGKVRLSALCSKGGIRTPQGGSDYDAFGPREELWDEWKSRFSRTNTESTPGWTSRPEPHMRHVDTNAARIPDWASGATRERLMMEAGSAVRIRPKPANYAMNAKSG